MATSSPPSAAPTPGTADRLLQVIQEMTPPSRSAREFYTTIGDQAGGLG